MFYLLFCVMSSRCFWLASQSNWMIASLISPPEKLGCRGSLWLPYVFEGAGNKLWCPKSSSPLQPSDRIGLSAVCFVLAVLPHWRDTESMEFAPVRWTGLQGKASVWHFAHCVLLTGCWHSQPLASTKHLNSACREVFQPFSRNKSFHYQKFELHVFIFDSMQQSPLNRSGGLGSADNWECQPWEGQWFPKSSLTFACTLLFYRLLRSSTSLRKPFIDFSPECQAVFD